MRRPQDAHSTPPDETGGGHCILANSIRANGIIQPIVARKVDEGYEIIAGERRWRAAREAGVELLPALVREADDRDTLLLGLVENVARENLSPVEEARAYAVLVDNEEATDVDIMDITDPRAPVLVNDTLDLVDLFGVFHGFEWAWVKDRPAVALVDVNGWHRRERGVPRHSAPSSQRWC